MSVDAFSNLVISFTIASGVVGQYVCLRYFMG